MTPQCLSTKKCYQAPVIQLDITMDFSVEMVYIFPIGNSIKITLKPLQLKNILSAAVPLDAVETKTVLPYQLLLDIMNATKKLLQLTFQFIIPTSVNRR